MAGASCALCFGLLVTGNWMQAVLGFEFRDAAHRAALLASVAGMLALSEASRRGKVAARALVPVMRANEACQIAWSALMLAALAFGSTGLGQGGAPVWASALSGWMMAATLNEWNPHMAAREPGDSAAVVLATLGSCGLFLAIAGAAGAGLPQAAWLAVCLPGASACCGLALRGEAAALVSPGPGAAPGTGERRRMRRWFLRERVVFGLVFGLTMSVAVARAALPSQPADPAACMAAGAALLAVVAAALAAGAARYLRPYLVLCLPLMLALACQLLFERGEGWERAQTCAAVTWLTWYIYSYSEMPVYRQATGEAALPFGWTEKCATLLTLMPVSLAVAAARASLPEAAQEALGAVGVWSTYAILGLFIAMIAVLLYRHFPDAGGIAKTGLTDDEAAAALAARAGLTAREADVLRLMCLGYTRPRIMGELGISEGTAKTHIHHVYEKTGLAGHDELVDAFRAAKAGRG